MSGSNDPERWNSADWTRSIPETPEAVDTVEAYETEDGVVLHDAEDPLAWVEATRAVRLDEYA